MTPVPVRFQNTFSGKVEPFSPLEEGKVKMYVCSVTPYDECHLGHARCYVTFDFIRRAFGRLGYAVTHVQNFTDIDDKIIKRAAERGEDPSTLAERYIQDYFDKMDKLGVRRADVYPRVTQHITQIVAFVERLVRQGMAYPVDGDVYYAVRKFSGYGKLSKRSLDELVSGARVEVDDRKHDPLDFALWKAAKPGEPSWDSPWGKGRPGWHIECSVMSIENLKTETFDIHGGGQDLIFPHHENEIAQAEGATGKTFARYWIHNGFVTVNKEKMSKSLGNFFTLKDIFAKFDPRAVRLLLLGQHYRTPLEFSDDLLQQAAAALRKWEEQVHRLRAVIQTQKGKDKQDEKVLADRQAVFESVLNEALSDDFNSPRALAALYDFFGELNTRTATHKSISVPALEKGLDAVLSALKGVFGIDLAAAPSVTAAPPGAATPLVTAVPPGTEESAIQNLVDRREAARRAKNWAEADRLRKELTEKNIVLEDTPRGPRWWKK